jgi:hypothetical protein
MQNVGVPLNRAGDRRNDAAYAAARAMAEATNMRPQSIMVTLVRDAAQTQTTGQSGEQRVQDHSCLLDHGRAARRSRYAHTRQPRHHSMCTCHNLELWMVLLLCCSEIDALCLERLILPKPTRQRLVHGCAGSQQHTSVQCTHTARGLLAIRVWALLSLNSNVLQKGGIWIEYDHFYD